MIKLVEAAVKEGININMGGGTGSGKTTVLKVMSEFIKTGSSLSSP
jgi:Flp pilus assembly CpaF family ATPase